MRRLLETSTSQVEGNEPILFSVAVAATVVSCSRKMRGLSINISLD